MKKISLFFSFVTFISSILFADYHITRGSDIGEIYFIGPTATTEEGLYHSTNFGENAVCVDSLLHTNWDLMSITADLTPGVIYGCSMPENLYISYNYGQHGSWIFRTAEGSYKIDSGRNEGEIFKGVSMRSNNYGLNFITNLCQGLFGFPLIMEIDNQDSIAYAVVNQWGIPDTLWLLVSYNNYENLEIQNVFNINEDPFFDISRGTENGELYNFAGSPKSIFYSNDYGLNWQYINEFNYGLDYTDLVGGRQEGEVYLLATYISGLSIDKHIYIFHSTDYGHTFEVFHPFSHGEEPLVANFSTSQTDSIAPVTVQFCNYSVGDIQTYEWDFNNDNIIDSYEEEPEYTYQDTGYYSIKLTIYNVDESDEFLRENYIYVTGGSSSNEQVIILPKIEMHNYPNPFNPTTTISYDLPINIENAIIEIFNIKGEKVRSILTFPSGSCLMGTSSVVWDGKDKYHNQVSSGVYLYRIKTDDYVSKTNRMLLLK
jgi:PKD repeat protein